MTLALAPSSPRHAGPYDDPAGRARALVLAMWVFVASELMFFAALFGLYAADRVAFPEAFRAGVAHDRRDLGSLNTVILLASSWLVALAVHALREGRGRSAAARLSGAAALGLAFLGVKSWEWGLHFREGIFPGARFSVPELASVPGARAFFDLYFALTGLHALHVVVGIALLVWIAVLSGRGHLGREPHDHVRAELVGLYWHLVDAVWLFLWPLFYLLR